MKPAISLLDPAFKYTDAANTNVARTFAKVRRQQREAAIQRQAQEARDKAGIFDIKRKSA